MLWIIMMDVLTNNVPQFQKGRYISTAAVAARLGISPRTVRLWAECRELSAIKVGRQWRFNQAYVEDWVNARFHDDMPKQQ
jgi:excisionase family DNA binding protein